MTYEKMQSPLDPPLREETWRGSPPFCFLLSEGSQEIHRPIQIYLDLQAASVFCWEIGSLFRGFILLPTLLTLVSSLSQSGDIYLQGIYIRQSKVLSG